MNCQALAFPPSIPYNRQSTNISDLLKDADLTKPIGAFMIITERNQILKCPPLEIRQRTEPLIDQSKPSVLHNRAHTPAAVVPAHDDVVHFQNIDGILNDGASVEILRGHQVRHVPMNEQFTRQEPDDLVGRDTTVGAANP